MKKINIITPGIKYGGGMERYVCELIENLINNNYSVTAYCLKYDKELFANDSNITIKQSQIIRHLPRFLKYLCFAIKVYISTRKLKAINIATARIFNAHIAIVGGTHQIHNQLMDKKNGLYDKIEIFLEKKMYQNAKHIMAHSWLMADEINTYKLNIESKISMCFPPVSQKAFHYVKPDDKNFYRTKLGLPQNKYILLALGTENPRKGVPKVVEALKQLDKDKFFLVILGKGYNATLPDNAKSCGLVNNVQDYYAAADITIAPSIYEPFGLIVIESLEVGTPVIISKNLGSKGFVTPDNGIILKDTSPQTIKEAVLKASHMQFTCEKNFVGEQSLTWDAHIKKLQVMFD